MRPARKPWTPSIKAAGLGMLPMGSVGSIVAVSCAHGRLDGVEQSVAAEGLSRECDGASLEGSPARLFVAVSGQNDSRDPGAHGAQMPEEVEAIHPGHPQIEHKTPGVPPRSRLEEPLRGGGGLDPEADRRQEIPD